MRSARPPKRLWRLALAASLGVLVLVGSFVTTLMLSGLESAPIKEAKPKQHRIVFQINSDDPTTMKHVITNAINATKAFKDRNEPLAIEVVAYGPGIHMLRVDTSPVRDLLAFLRASAPDIVLSACGNTKQIMERNEGRPIALVEDAIVVPFGIVRLVELQEAGWSYIRP